MFVVGDSSGQTCVWIIVVCRTGGCLWRCPRSSASRMFSTIPEVLPSRVTLRIFCVIFTTICFLFSTRFWTTTASPLATIRRGDRGGSCLVQQTPQDGRQETGKWGFRRRDRRCVPDFPHGRLSPTWDLHLCWLGIHSHRRTWTCQLPEEHPGHVGISLVVGGCEQEKKDSLRGALQHGLYRHFAVLSSTLFGNGDCGGKLVDPTRMSSERPTTVDVNLDDWSIRITTPPVSIHRKNCKLLKKMLPMCPSRRQW